MLKVYIFGIIKAYAMRVILDLEETVLETLQKQAEAQNRSRKNYMETILVNVATSIPSSDYTQQKESISELKFRVAKNNEPENKKRLLEEREGLKSKIEYNIPLTPNECFDGKKIDRYILDEVGLTAPATTKTISERIKDLEDEIVSSGPMAVKLIAFNQKKIKELKRQL